MPLPEPFAFSQSSLQDYVDCPRRFQLRHLLLQPWPAWLLEPAGEAEHFLERGTELHRLAQQHALGVDAERLAESIHDTVVAAWWSVFLREPPPNLPAAVRRPEVVLTAPLAGRRLAAKLDLLAVDPGRQMVIVDWKTVPRRPTRTTLARRLQTRIYRYLAVEAGEAINGGERPHPEQVEMVYWFAAASGEVERFAYDADQWRTDQGYLYGLAVEIASRAEPVWPLTSDQQRCRTCTYRSLCDRGSQPAFLYDLEDDLEAGQIEVTLEQVAEIEF